MNLFGMGAGEIMVIMIVALIIFGPGRLPEIMSQVGRTVREFKKATRDLTGEFQDSLQDVQATMGEMKTAVAEVKRETAQIASSIPASVEQTIGADEIRESVAGAAAVVKPEPATANGAAPAKSRTQRAARPKTATPDTAPAAIEPAPVESIAQNGAAEAAPVATKDDPFADLAELDEIPEPTGTTPTRLAP